ncbi:non-ribosomal peptide synthetase [Micromonospora sp. R77]|uniref:non-ribosomal peptide synthetase n=1 Tax=Micromonospora sp. R77 TaxID=2925836 RepID=UPI001F61F51E|nr:non-ribosomal peptide synthetase [Micromonospora sp. R77]MCI4065664.1 non-ribosomal peptide synthetase [Micromonospora sp. R77]
MDTTGYWERLLEGAEPTRLDAVRPAPSGPPPAPVTVPGESGSPGPAELVAAVALVLAAHAGADEVCFAVRPTGGSTVPVRVRPAYAQTVMGFVAGVQAQLAAAQAQAAALAGLDLSAWCDVVVDLDGGPLESTSALTWDAHGSLRYDPARLAADAGRRLDRGVRRMLELFGAVPGGTPLWTLDVLAPAERRQVLRHWNDTAVDLGPPDTIHGLVERQVAATPDALAVVAGPTRLSYAELDRRAGLLAANLAAAGAGPGRSVALYLDRTAHLVVAMLGVLKAGAAYLPVDPGLPPARTRALLDALDVAVVVTDAAAVPVVCELAAEAPSVRDVVYLADETTAAPPVAGPRLRHGYAAVPAGSPAPVAATPDDVAYTIFTSGSTGTPKGVTLTHAPVVNLIRWVNTTHGMGPDDQVLFVTSPGFDLSVYDVFGLLAAGGSIRVAASDEVRDPHRLLAVLDSEPITFWDSAPAALQQVEPLFTARAAPAGSTLRLVFLSGDWVPLTLPGAVRAAFPGATVVALGGATEAAIWSNSFPADTVDPEWPSVPYGRPIANARYHVLDGWLRPVPVGAPGDLYIAGDCLALGYHGDGALTAGKFLPDPFGPTAGARMYATGDRARYWPNGVLEFLGRRDDQVKVRGYRIELGEISSALADRAEVSTAVAVVHGAGPAARIVAYAVPRPGVTLDPAALRRDLAARLPEYMVPTQVVPIDTVPTTANGKLDREALPVPDPATDRADFAAPDSPAEKAVAEIWSQVLGVERIGLHDNFFDLGGHSLLIAQLIATLQSSLDVTVPMTALLQHQTLGAFAAAVEQAVIEDELSAGEEETGGR